MLEALKRMAVDVYGECATIFLLAMSHTQVVT